MVVVRKIKTELDLRNDISSEPQMEAPSLSSMDEFLSTIRKKYRIETLGSFIHWIQRTGKTPKMSIKQWEDNFHQFMTRKV